MKKILLFLSSLSLALCAAAQDPYAESALVKPGDAVPSFSVKMLDGNTVSSGRLKGKVVLINFWATWCPYCIRELNHIQAGGLGELMKNRDFVFLPISRGESRRTVEAFVEKRAYTFDVAIDPDQTVWSKFATRAIPRNFVINRDGKVVFASVGYSEQDFEHVVTAVKRALE